MEDMLDVTRQLADNVSSFKHFLANRAFNSNSSLAISILHIIFYICVMSMILSLLEVGLGVTHALVVKHRISLMSSLGIRLILRCRREETGASASFRSLFSLVSRRKIKGSRLRCKSVGNWRLMRAISSIAWTFERIQVASDVTVSDLVYGVLSNSFVRLFIKFFEGEASFDFFSPFLYFLLTNLWIFNVVEQAEDTFINEKP